MAQQQIANGNQIRIAKGCKIFCVYWYTDVKLGAEKRGQLQMNFEATVAIHHILGIYCVFITFAI